MGKKVRIPIKGNQDTTEFSDAGDDSTVDDVQPETAEELAVDGLFTDETTEPSAAEQNVESRLDSDFADRDVDFSGFDDPAASAAAETAPPSDTQKLQQELNEYQQKYLRALADMDNFRKRAQKEKSDLLKYQGEKILADIVEVLDNLELALQHKDAEIENLRTGIEMIHQQFIDVLGRWGVRAESSVGSQFDPNRQNAINKIATADADPGSVLAELKKAYFYKDKLLRVAEVVVAEAVENNEESSSR